MDKLNDLIQDIDKIKAMKQSMRKVLLELFAREDLDIYIYGAGYVGRAICEKMVLRGYSVRGFIDRDQTIKSCMGYPVCTLESVQVKEQKSLVIISMLAVEYFAVLRDTLTKAGFQYVFSFNELRPYHELFEAGEPFFAGLGLENNIIFDHEQEILEVYNMLSDTMSKKCYCEVLRFLLVQRARNT